MDLNEQKYLQESVKITKLSEAIRIGAKLRPQGFGERNENTSCALQAAHEATEGKWCGPWPALCWGHKLFPEDIILQVIRKNDLGMARETIADWLEAKGY